MSLSDVVACKHAAQEKTVIEEEQCKSLATQVSLPPPLSRRRRAARLYTSRLEITAWLRTHPAVLCAGNRADAHCTGSSHAACSRWAGGGRRGRADPGGT